MCTRYCQQFKKNNDSYPGIETQKLRLFLDFLYATVRFEAGSRGARFQLTVRPSWIEDFYKCSQRQQCTTCRFLSSSAIWQTFFRFFVYRDRWIALVQADTPHRGGGRVIVGGGGRWWGRSRWWGEQVVEGGRWRPVRNIVLSSGHLISIDLPLPPHQSLSEPSPCTLPTPCTPPPPTHSYPCYPLLIGSNLSS